jgi:hypothetical protein
MSSARAREFRNTCSILCILVVAACAGPIKTSFDLDPDADFSRYKTFAWISDDPIIEPGNTSSGGRYASPLDEQRIRSAVESELAKKGYRPAELAKSDLVVTFEIGSEEIVRVQPEPGVGRVYTQRGGHGTVYSEQTARVTSYVEGTLIVKFYDRVSKQSVWVGWGSKRLTEADEPDKVINKAVTLILAPFPSKFESTS